jgi:DNA-binding transcriptional regulator YdaS (Cro superfamily)
MTRTKTKIKIKAKTRKPRLELEHAAIVRLIEYFGGQSSVAEALDVKQGAVSNWFRNQNDISSDNARKAEVLTDGAVLACDLCPAILELDKIIRQRAG